MICIDLTLGWLRKCFKIKLISILYMGTGVIVPYLSLNLPGHVDTRNFNACSHVLELEMK